MCKPATHVSPLQTQAAARYNAPMKKALVTGATGFVGSAIVRELLASGQQVKILRRANSPLGNVNGLDVEHAVGDLMEPQSLAAALRDVDRVYHCAALYSLKGGYDDYLRNNAVGTKNVMRACLDARIERVVYTSTIAAVGSERSKTRITEETIWNFAPFNNPYITSKYIAEFEAMRFGARGLPVIVINPGAPIGERDAKPTPTGLLIVMLLTGLIPVVPVAFPMADVRDVARLHRLAMEKGQPGERYLCVQSCPTVVQVAKMLRERIGMGRRLRLPGFLFELGVASTWLLPQFLSQFTGAARFTLKRFDYDCTKSEALGLKYGPLEDALERAARWYIDEKYAGKPWGYKA